MPSAAGARLPAGVACLLKPALAWLCVRGRVQAYQLVLLHISLPLHPAHTAAQAYAPILPQLALVPAAPVLHKQVLGAGQKSLLATPPPVPMPLSVFVSDLRGLQAFAAV
jgi:hypothetical protein